MLRYLRVLVLPSLLGGVAPALAQEIQRLAPERGEQLAVLCTTATAALGDLPVKVAPDTKHGMGLEAAQ